MAEAEQSSKKTALPKGFTIVVVAASLLSVCLILAYAWGADVGQAGVTCELVGGVGFVVFGAVLVVLAIALLTKGIATLRLLEGDNRREWVAEQARLARIVALNFAVYVCCPAAMIFAPVLLAIYGAAASLIVVPIEVGGIAAIIAYFAHRRSNRIDYAPLQLTLFPMLYGAFGVCVVIVAGSTMIPNACSDLTDGPCTVEASLIETEYVSGISHHYRHAVPVKSRYRYTFRLANGEKLNLSVYTDERYMLAMALSSDTVRLSYYPRTRVFDEASTALLEASGPFG